MASIRRTPCGTWRAIVRRTGYRPHFRTFGTHQDAKHWARLIESEVDRAVFVDRGPSERVRSTTFRAWLLLASIPSRRSRSVQPHLQFD